jgi:hypothetical protein
LATFPFPTDGLVFTPAAMPYVLGMNQLLMKWQPQQQAAADIRGKDLTQLFDSRWYIATCNSARKPRSRAARIKRLQQLPSCLVYECCQVLPSMHQTEHNKPQQPGRSAARRKRRPPELATDSRYRLWEPLSVRWDKSTGNNPTVRAQLEQQGLPGTDSSPLTHAQLVQAVREVESIVTTAAATPSTSSSSSSTSSSSTTYIATPAGCGASPMAAAAPSVHPARTMPFDELYAAVQAEVEAHTVHCTTDSASGLEIYCYDLSSGPPSSSTAAMCRGLVLHPASSSVVATPFARFGGPSSVPAMQRALATAAVAVRGISGSTRMSSGLDNRSRGRGGRGSRSGSGRGAASLPAADAKASKPDALQLYKLWSASPQASASVKVDGSLVLAFMWQGQLQVATRRRMDSEQVRGGSCAETAAGLSVWATLQRC